MPELVASSEDTRIYEICVLYPYPMNQKEEQTLLKEIDELFAEAGATLVLKDAWGRRGLAYPVNGATEGTFVVYYYEMDPSKLKEVDLALRIMKGVLRHMVVKPPKHYQVVKFSEAYELWLKERETMEEQKVRQKEEKVQEQVARKAKRQAKAAAERKKSTPAEQPGGVDLTQKIDELISDDSLTNL
ncbi:MAG: 30S ribosomal protein S6 [Candidatus Peribacteraceae bacterium]|nr:30S ribosomal protein S6 [Candidatus Peribacteraceae bacterium]